MKFWWAGVAMLGMGSAVWSAANAQPAGSPENYKVDAVHSSVIFRVKHMNVSYAYGRFNELAGEFSYDESNPANSQFTVQLQATSVDTGNKDRDDHLRNADFFDVGKFATIEFKSDKVTPKGKDQFEVAGTLTFMGVSKPLTVTMDHTGYGADPWGGYRRGFETTFTIKRSDWGMNKMLEGIGDEVRLIVSLEGIRQ
ncbi:MAG: Protein YceI [Phycisphaerae bacterium]|nr:Protein YceI [Phycisphaerae bacterium]